MDTKKQPEKPKEKQARKPAVALGLQGRVLRLEMPRVSLEQMEESYRRLHEAAEPELERLRRDKSWNRNSPKHSLHIQVAVEEMMNDKSWDRSAPNGWLQERAAREEERERQSKKSRARKGRL